MRLVTSIHLASIKESNQILKTLFVILNVHKYWSMVYKNRIINQKIKIVRNVGNINYRYLKIINYEVIILFCVLFLTHGEVETNPTSEKKYLITFYTVTASQIVFWPTIKSLY